MERGIISGNGYTLENVIDANMLLPAGLTMADSPVSSRSESKSGSRLKRFFKGVANALPIYSSLKTNDVAVDNAMKIIGSKAGSNSNHIGGNDLWETEYICGINNRATRKALMNRISEKNYTIDGAVESAHEIKNDQSTWTSLRQFAKSACTKDLFSKKELKELGSDSLDLLQSGLNGALTTTGLDNYLGKLEVYKGEKGWDTFWRNTRMSGEVQAAISGTLLGSIATTAAINAYCGYVAGGSIINGLKESTGSGIISSLYGGALSAGMLLSAAYSGNILGAARSAAILAQQYAAHKSKGNRNTYSGKAAGLLGLAVTAGLLASCENAYGQANHHMHSSTNPLGLPEVAPEPEATPEARIGGGHAAAHPAPEATPEYHLAETPASTPEAPAPHTPSVPKINQVTDPLPNWVKSTPVTDASPEYNLPAQGAASEFYLMPSPIASGESGIITAESGLGTPEGGIPREIVVDPFDVMANRYPHQPAWRVLAEANTDNNDWLSPAEYNTIDPKLGIPFAEIDAKNLGDGVNVHMIKALFDRQGYHAGEHRMHTPPAVIPRAEHFSPMKIDPAEFLRFMYGDVRGQPLHEAQIPAWQDNFWNGTDNAPVHAVEANAHAAPSTPRESLFMAEVREHSNEPLWKILALADSDRNGIVTENEADAFLMQRNDAAELGARYHNLGDFTKSDGTDGISIADAKAFLDDYHNTYLHNYRLHQREHIGGGNIGIEGNKFVFNFADPDYAAHLDSHDNVPKLGFVPDESDVVIRIFRHNDGTPIAIADIGDNGVSDNLQFRNGIKLSEQNIFDGNGNLRSGYFAEAAVIGRNETYGFGNDEVFIFDRIGGGHGHVPHARVPHNPEPWQVICRPSGPDPDNPMKPFTPIDDIPCNARDMSIKYKTNGGLFGLGGVYNPAAFANHDNTLYVTEGETVRVVVPPGEGQITDVYESDGTTPTQGRESFWNFARPHHREVYVEGKKFGGLRMDHGHVHYNGMEDIQLRGDQGVKFDYHPHHPRCRSDSSQPGHWYQRHVEVEPGNSDMNEHVLRTRRYNGAGPVGEAVQNVEVEANPNKYRAEGFVAGLPAGYALHEVLAPAAGVREVIKYIPGPGGIGGQNGGPGIVGGQ